MHNFHFANDISGNDVFIAHCDAACACGRFTLSSEPCSTLRTEFCTFVVLSATGRAGYFIFLKSYWAAVFVFAVFAEISTFVLFFAFWTDFHFLHLGVILAATFCPPFRNFYRDFCIILCDGYFSILKIIQTGSRNNLNWQSKSSALPIKIIWTTCP